MIFKDKAKLSPRYIPERLPHREDEISKILSMLPEEPEQANLVLQLQGPPGTGKTSSAVHVGRRISSPEVTYLYVNLKILGSKFAAYRELLRQFLGTSPSRSLSSEEMLVQLIRGLKEKKKYAAIILDEIDYFLKSSRDTSIVYDMTRINEIDPIEGSNVICTMFIVRDPKWRRGLGGAERSSLGSLIVLFNPYTKEQLVDILNYRAEEAFTKGAVDLEVVEYVAEQVVEESEGDVRYALDILLHAGTLAENRGQEKVTLDDVREVISQLSPNINSEELQALNKNEKIILLSLAYALKSSSQPYVGFSDLYEVYKEVARSYRISSSIKMLEKGVQDLHDRNIIRVSGISRIGLNAPVNKLIPIVERLIKTIKEGHK
ncbi:MAG: hypothetical protein DRJ41_00900 [Thermoprotei archaeon]|nr:MAG: hypothetical protein DRJ41_00900 [Thermoprotei archaeon]HDI31475.1 AAA family ATPase [Thermofilum sp.]